jgi:hypothetical protein
MTTPTEESYWSKITGIFSDSQDKIDKDYNDCVKKCSDTKSARSAKLSGTVDPNAKPFYQLWGGKRRRTKRSQRGGNLPALSPSDYSAVGGKRRKSTKRRQRGGNADAKPTPQPQVSPNTSSYTATAGEYKAVGGKRRKSRKSRK